MYIYEVSKKRGINEHPSLSILVIPIRPNTVFYSSYSGTNPVAHDCNASG